MENKYQEALRFVVNTSALYVDDNNSLKRLSNASKNLQELVDKETPMKPIVDKHSRDKICGKCKKSIVGIYGYLKQERCWLKECGQVVDWSDE